MQFVNFGLLALAAFAASPAALADKPLNLQLPLDYFITGAGANSSATGGSDFGTTLHVNACSLPGDPLLGGVNFRGDSSNTNDCRYGAPYLEAIYAHNLFELLGNPKLDTYAASKGLDPKSPAAADQFAKEVNGQLNQLFVLKTLGAMLDNEAMMSKLPLDVPMERIDYAVRKILFVDNKSLNDAILQDFIQAKVLAAAQGGEAAIAKLADIGITSDIVDLVLQRTAPDSAAAKDPMAAFEAFKTSFDGAVSSELRAPGHSIPGLKAPAYADLTPLMLARYADIMNPTRDLQTLFTRLSTKVGKGPFLFGVTWTEGATEPLLSSLGARFADQWKPGIIAGQNPAAGAPDPFPETLEGLYKFVEKKLSPLQRSLVRQVAAKKWLFSFWRNMDLPNPHPPHDAKHISEIFNPLSSLMLTITSQELQSTYSEVKFDIGARPQPDFKVIEVVLGANTSDVSTSAPTDPCVAKFNTAFEKPFGEQQQAVLTQLGDAALTTKKFDQLVRGARDQIPASAFAAAQAALKADPACATFPVSFTVQNVHFDPNAKDLSADDKARSQFVSLFMQTEQLQKMMIPKRSRRDSQGNVHHYFFHTRKVTYAYPDDPAVGPFLKDEVVIRRLADRMHEAVANAIEPRFRVSVYTQPFSYNGADGFQLKSAAGDPRKWLEQIFIVARMQTNPELVMARRLIEHSTKTFERSYDIQ